MSVAAVIFDLDGVLIDSEELWAGSRERVARDHGGRWDDTTQRRMMGMSSHEWAPFMRDELGIDLEPERIVAEVIRRIGDAYRRELPLIPGALDAVRRLDDQWPLALASSADRSLIDLVLELAGVEACFGATVSSEEVERGKPAPDVYLEAARRLEVDPREAVAIEDSTNGIRAGLAAGMAVIAIPDRVYPPSAEALGEASLVLDSIAKLDAGAVEAAASTRAASGAPGPASPLV